jgi:hypothetical protein
LELPLYSRHLYDRQQRLLGQTWTGN